MPGSRLTHEDRRRIAAGLADGLGYAEIARLLGRPTSTISREVARNSGPHGYRANQAHQAAGWRARRKRSERPAIPVTPAATTDTSRRNPGAVREFEQRFVAMMIQTGVPPMMARVLSALFTCDSGSLTAAELVQRLQVSPASISKAINYLEPLRLVRRERDAQGRRDRYVMSDDVWYQAWQSSNRSILMWAATTEEGADVLGRATHAGARLHMASQFFQLIAHEMAEAAAHWRQALTGETRAATEPHEPERR